jgi:HD-like signal output (HDOD) protein
VSPTIVRDDGLARGGGGSAPGASALKRILFVDDEPDLFDSLRDALRRYRRRWEVNFAASGPEALERLSRWPADVVVTDMRMPVMDGATLLSEVSEHYPTTIRIVLSGQMNPQLVARAGPVAHRFLAKPCKVEELGRVIERSCELRALTEQAEAYRVTAAATALPSRPGLYTEITQIAADPNSTPEQIAAVIERDMAMTAKLLQLANSAFFGIGRTISRVRDAVVYLGAETIKSLALTAEAFGKLAPSRIEGFSLEEFQRHATLVAWLTTVILPRGPAQQQVVTAALLHDIGKLVLIGDDRRRWLRLSTEARRRWVPLHVIEAEQESVTHAATGAYLLSLWGLPDDVVEAVAHHHDPGPNPGVGLDPMVAVHIADALANEAAPSRVGGPPPGMLDEELIDRLGLRSQLADWRRLAASRA